MGPQQLSVTARRIRGSFPAAAVCQSRGGRTRRPGVGRKLSARPETQHPPVGGEVLAGPCRAPLPSSRPTPSGPVGVGHNHSPHEATDQPARRAKPSAPRSADRGSKPPPTVPQQAARWVRTRVRRLRTTAEALDLNRICDLWHAYLGPAAAQGSGPALARRRRPIASRQLSLARGCRRAHL